MALVQLQKINWKILRTPYFTDFEKTTVNELARQPWEFCTWETPIFWGKADVVTNMSFSGWKGFNRCTLRKLRFFTSKKKQHEYFLDYFDCFICFSWLRALNIVDATLLSKNKRLKKTLWIEWSNKNLIKLIYTSNILISFDYIWHDYILTS